MKQIFTDSYSHIVGNWLLPFYEGRLRGRDTFRYLKEFEQNQWRSSEEIERLQWQKLCSLLHHAYSTVEYYRHLCDEAGLHPGEIDTPSDFARLPLLDK